MTLEVRRIPVTMVRGEMGRLPSVTVPSGYCFRGFTAGEEGVWAAIEAAVGEFSSRDEALNHFHEEFGEHLDEMEERCLFLARDDGYPVGTATAWYGEYGGRICGRLHWVAVRPRYQGRGLGRVLITYALRHIARKHECAYLTSQTTSYVAIGIYLDLGFRPVIGTARDREAWMLLAEILEHPLLEGVGL